MGQFFILINIDKEQKVHLDKLGIFFMEVITYLCDPDAQSSWAGDRLILLGSYVSNIPAGIEDETNYEDLFAMFVSGDDSEDPPCREECHYDETSVLRNLCTREYIRADLFPDRGSFHPRLGYVIMSKIIWYADDWRRPWPDVDPRGAWAGGRFDVVHADVVKGHSEWKDITQTEFFNYYKTSTNLEEKNPLAPECTCGLCQKGRDEHENFYNNIQKQKTSRQQERSHDTVRKRATHQSWSATGAFYPSGANSLSSIEILPAELREEIMAYLNTGDLAACAAASKILSFQATPFLYSSVTIERADQTKTLLETISRCPELTGCIKNLRVVTLAHWESLQIAHEILIQLPHLKSLNIARCWLSYGNLPYWEYPFTLSTLTWGLKKHSAFDQFCLSQPGVQTVLLDPVIDGFTF